MTARRERRWNDTGDFEGRVGVGRIGGGVKRVKRGRRDEGTDGGEWESKGEKAERLAEVAKVVAALVRRILNAVFNPSLLIFSVFE
jgi:hypothetical protein